MEQKYLVKVPQPLNGDTSVARKIGVGCRFRLVHRVGLSYPVAYILYPDGGTFVAFVAFSSFRSPLCPISVRNWANVEANVANLVRKIESFALRRFLWKYFVARNHPLFNRELFAKNCVACKVSVGWFATGYGFRNNANVINWVTMSQELLQVVTGCSQRVWASPIVSEGLVDIHKSWFFRDTN